MKSFFIAFVVLAALSVAGCVRQDAVKVKEVENISVSVRDGVKLNAILRVENSAGRNIKISDVRFDVNDLRGKNIGELVIDEELFIPKKSEISILVPVNVYLKDAFGGLRMLRDIAGIKDKLLVTGSAQMKMGVVKKKITFTNVLLSDILAIFETPDPSSDPYIIEGAQI